MSEWLGGAFEMMVSPLLIAELSRVLEYPKISARVSERDATEFVDLIRRQARMAGDPAVPSLVEPSDPDDAYLVTLAESERAILVTGDRGLLELSGQIPVMAPGEFLEWLDTQ